MRQKQIMTLDHLLFLYRKEPAFCSEETKPVKWRGRGLERKYLRNPSGKGRRSKQTAVPPLTVPESSRAMADRAKSVARGRSLVNGFGVGRLAAS